MLPATIKLLSIQPAQASIILFVDIFSLRRTGILHTVSFSEYIIKNVFYILGSLIFKCVYFFLLPDLNIL
jgi:hypothetical protein